MKYCAKCGMLLEDNHEICIGCGASVKEPGTFSLYPPNVEQNIKTESAVEKKRGTTIALLIVVFILLVAAITGFIIFNASNLAGNAELKPAEAAEDLAAQELTEEKNDTIENADTDNESSELSSLKTELVSDTQSDDNVTSEAEDVTADGEIKDDKGMYYVYSSLSDKAGNAVFSTLYPEDFNPVMQDVSMGVYSDKFPESITFIVSNKDNNVKFTYMSPQHFWHRDSKNGKSRNNERNVKDYMMFFTYAKAEGYIDALIKQSYTDIKGFKLVKTETIDEDMLKHLEDFSREYAKTLAGLTEDYAHIGADTSYAAMASDFEASIFSYEATTRQNNTIYMDFYVPMIANTLSYASEQENDMGNVIEWFPLEVVAFEAGNEELHDMYKDAFKMFICNSRLSKEFFYDNEQYGKEIKAAVSDGKEPAPLTENKLKSYHEESGSEYTLDDFYDGIYTYTAMSPKDSINYKNDKMSVMCPTAYKTAYYNSENKKLFVSPDETENPGDPYQKLEAQAQDE